MSGKGSTSVNKERTKKAGVRTLRTANQLLSALVIPKAKGALYSLFHYTSVESFTHIIEGNGIRLSRMDQMNDGTEKFEGADRTYAFCMSAVPTESAGMWIAYGLPRKDAVRVRFSGKAFCDLCDTNKGGGRISVVPVKDGCPCQKAVCGTASLQYVGYVSRSGERVHVRNVIYRFPVGQEMKRAEVMNRFGSFIKILGWEYEHEVRLVVKLDEAIDAEMIQVAVPEIIKKMLTYSPKRRSGTSGMPSVIVGPWGNRREFMQCFTSSMESLKCEDRNDIRYFIAHSTDDNGIVRESEFKGKIHLGRCKACKRKSVCDCAYCEGDTEAKSH